MKALVVDDSRVMRSILRRTLEGIDFDVFEANNGKEALTLLEDTEPLDLALVDWNMPEMNGIDLIRAVRADARYDDMKIIIVSADSEKDRIDEALAAGSDGYLMKPLDNEVIVEKIGLLGLG